MGWPVARVARDVGARVVAVMTRPFRFEGGRRVEQADLGVRQLAAEADTHYVVPLDSLTTHVGGVSVRTTLSIADAVLAAYVEAIVRGPSSASRPDLI